VTRTRRRAAIGRPSLPAAADAVGEVGARQRATTKTMTASLTLETIATGRRIGPEKKIGIGIERGIKIGMTTIMLTVTIQPL
jgi:hypothetical protein